MTWYNKYRPTKFSEVVGQEMAKKILENSLKYNRIKHAYLFSGPKGVGKTTLARIFANELNQTRTNPEANLDIIELDAASHTGIDDIRLLIESAQTPPMSGKYKIFIIDEVHMLSKSAMNALLKILEEPPSYLIFLLATTNEEKLLPTILSRLTRLKLTTHSETDIVNRLAYITQQEGMIIDQEALRTIAKRSHGSQRDAINLLETLFGYNLDKYTNHEVYQLLGLVPTETLQHLADNLVNANLISPELINEIETSGIDGQELLSQLLELVLDTSLSGQSQWDRLILALAEVLSWQLPISSPLAALSLVKVKLQILNSAESSETSSGAKKKDFSQPSLDISKNSNWEPATEENQATQTQKPNVMIIDPNTDASDHADKTETNHSSNSVITPSNEEITHFLADLARLPDCKPGFKIMVTDLSGEVVNQSLILWTSKQTYQASLQNSDLQDWLKQHFHAKFGFTPVKIWVQLNKSDQLSTVERLETLETHPTEISQNSNINSSTTNQPKKIFYKIYRQLPEGVDPKAIDILRPPIILPNQKPQPLDDHLDGIFEFE